MSQQEQSVISTLDVKPGDRVARQVGRKGPLMWLTVTEVTDDSIFCNLWQFDRRSGAEIDHELRWGPEYGRTGSYLVQIIPSALDVTSA